MHTYGIWINQRSEMFLKITRNYLKLFKWKHCLVYLEDLVIFSNAFDDHISYFDQIFTSLMDEGVTLKIRKRYLLQRQVEYIGHMVKTGSL